MTGNVISGADIIAALRNPAITMDQTQINEAWNLLQARQSGGGARVTFRIGEEVEFTHSDGRVIAGFVKKVNAKTIGIQTPLGGWRVSPGLLRKKSVTAPHNPPSGAPRLPVAATVAPPVLPVAAGLAGGGTW